MSYRTLFPILASVAISGCCSAPDTRIGVPPGPDIQPIEQELWDTIPEHVREIMIYNTEQWEAWYDAAVGRIDYHDENL